MVLVLVGSCFKWARCANRLAFSARCAWRRILWVVAFLSVDFQLLAGVAAALTIPLLGCVVQGHDLESIVRKAMRSTLPWPEHAVTPCEVSVDIIPHC